MHAQRRLPGTFGAHGYVEIQHVMSGKQTQRLQRVTCHRRFNFQQKQFAGDTEAWHKACCETKSLEWINDDSAPPGGRRAVGTERNVFAGFEF